MKPGKQTIMSKESDNKAIVGRWFTDFWGEKCELAIVDELAAPDIQKALGLGWSGYKVHGCARSEGDEGSSSPGHGAIVIEEAAAGSIMCDRREINHDPCALFHAPRTCMAVQIGGNITRRHRIDFNVGVSREPSQGIGVLNRQHCHRGFRRGVGETVVLLPEQGSWIGC